MSAPRAPGFAAAAALVFCTGIGMAHATTTTEALPETMGMLKHAIGIHTVEGEHQVPVLAAYLADKLKAGGFAASDREAASLGSCGGAGVLASGIDTPGEMNGRRWSHCKGRGDLDTSTRIGQRKETAR